MYIPSTARVSGGHQRFFRYTTTNTSTTNRTYQDKLKAVEEAQARFYEGTKTRCEISRASMDTAHGKPQEGICGLAVGHGRRESDVGEEDGAMGGFARADGTGDMSPCAVRPGGQSQSLQGADSIGEGRVFAAQLSETVATISRIVHGIKDAFRAHLAAVQQLEIACSVAARGCGAEDHLEASVLTCVTGP